MPKRQLMLMHKLWVGWKLKQAWVDYKARDVCMLAIS